MSDSFHEVWFLKYVRFINIGSNPRNLSISIFNGRSCTVARFDGFAVDVKKSAPVLKSPKSRKSCLKNFIQ